MKSIYIYFWIFPIQFFSFSFEENFLPDPNEFYCELGSNTENSCPIDGDWTTWSSWGTCMGNCGSKGTRIRNRSCSNPLPSNEGAPCIGPSYQVETCRITGCTINDYEKMVENYTIRRDEMRVVKAINERLPALIESCFSADCTYSLVEKILGSNAMLYWNAMNCVKYNVGCPVPGGWSPWETWSSCTAVCGRGKKFRLRKCNSPVPSDPELTCDGLPFDAKDCIGVDCQKHTSANWSDWSGWNECNVRCGIGIKMRKRSCEDGSQNGSPASCEGPTREIQPCEITNCSVDGSWSPWTIWTVCSSNCGIGTQTRNRMCNDPCPSGSGANCPGSATEVRQCFNKPCFVKTHQVAHFAKESSLFYPANDVPSRLLHVYLRFLPLVPFGPLLRRFQDNCEGPTCDFVELSLRNGKIVLSTRVSGCTLAIVHQRKLEIGQWHVTLALISGTNAMLRVNDASHKTAFFSCFPTMQNLDHPMIIGEGFQGQIQEIAINFAPLRLDLPGIEEEDVRVPSRTHLMQYSSGNHEEGFIYIASTQSIAVSCPKKRDSWRMTIVLRPEEKSGIIATIPGDFLNEYVLLTLEEERVKLILHQGTLRTMVQSADYISVGEWFEALLIQEGPSLSMRINGNQKNRVPLLSKKRIVIACTDNIYIGALSDEIKDKICPECARLPQMSFTLGYLDIDGIRLDLLSLPVFETTSKRFSSRAISFSDYYQEIPVALGKELKLSCFYDKNPGEGKIEPIKEMRASWLSMGKLLYSNERNDDFFLIKDDGRVSTICATSYATRSAIEKFYTCRVRRYKNNSSRIYALFTFGVTVIDENKEFGDAPRKKWSFICGIISLFLMSLASWLLLEGFLDARKGHGFYRLPRKVEEGNTASIIEFVLSTRGVILLGSRHAANQIVEKI